MYYISFSDKPLGPLKVDTKYYNTPEEAEDYIYKECPALDCMWMMTSKIGSIFNKKIPSIISVYQDGDSNRWARIVKVSEKKSSLVEKKKEERFEKKKENFSQHQIDVYYQSKSDEERSESGLLPKFLVVNILYISDWDSYREKNHLDKYVLIFHSSRTELIGFDKHHNGYAEYMVYRLMDKYLDFNQRPEME